MNILRSYKIEYPQKIKIILNGSSVIGVIDSFSMLIENSQEKYLMLCDQDDVWLKHKVRETVAEMQSLEAKFGEKTPLLVHTDLIVADNNLKIINDSFYAYSGRVDKPQILARILHQNFVTGCTMLLNRPLVDCCKSIPKDAIMHDWWIALVAFSIGHVGYVDTPSILYRQHSSNVIGAKKWSLSHIWLKGKQVLFSKNLKEHISRYHQQALSLAFLMEKEILPDNREIIDQFIELFSKGFFAKRYILLKYKFFKGRLSETIGLFIRI